MFSEILRFELRYQLRSPVFWLASLVFFLLTFGAVTTDAIIIGGSIGNIDRNAPYVITQIMAIMGIIGVWVAVAMVAGTVIRDYDNGTAALFFTTRVKKRHYLAGRFLGAFVATVLVFLGVALAITIGSAMPWLDPERVGPFRITPYVTALAWLVIPNLFLMSAIFFAVATATRSMMWTYVSVVGFFVLYSVAGTLLSDIENESLAAILDPFGFAGLQIATRYWTVAERNTQIIGLEGPLLTNRLVWVGLAVLILAVTYVRFTFTQKETRKKEKKRKLVEQQDERADSMHTTLALPAVTRDFSATGNARRLLRQMRLETTTVLRGLPFLILLALGIFNIVGASTTINQLFGTTVYPVTHLMLQVIAGSFLLFLVIILAFYSGEAVFRDRELNVHDVHGALPAPNWVFWGAKLLALLAVLMMLLLVAVLTGVAIQTWRGYTHYEAGLYGLGFIIRLGWPFALIAVLALALHVFSNNKYVGFLLIVLYFISAPVLAALDYDHNLYSYAASPPAPYSDMNGYGHFLPGQFWFHLYWSFFAVLLVAAIHLFWVRGRETALRFRLALARQRLRTPVALTIAAAALGFAATGGWIYYNTNVLNEYIPDDVQQARQERYEKEYGRYESAPEPRITAVYAEVDIHPYDRAVEVRGRYTLRNRTELPLDSVRFTIARTLRIDRFDLPGAAAVLEDEEVGFYIYALEEPWSPGEERTLEFTVGVDETGFTNGVGNTAVVHNGTFINNFAHFPHIGYAGQFELGDPNERRKRGLPPVERMPKLDDEAARMNTYISPEADWIEYETIVSTAADQIALAPGRLQREWEEDGRRYFHYRADSPILPIFAYLSADWEVARDRWNDVDIAIYHHPDHPYNVQRMIDATRKSLDYYTREFSPFQFSQVRIVEFPRYAQFAQSLPNLIPFSESIGFIARLDEDDEEAIDYVFYVTAHEVAHQWWAHQVIGANVQGATVMVETLAQYSALMVMEKEYGRDQMRRFLKYELDNYLSSRGGELIEELPLMLVENQPYIHYRKGSLVMYALRDYIGEAALNRALARFIRDKGFQQPPYTTTRELLSYIEAEVPPEQMGLIDDLFREITLFENRVEEASYSPTDDGRYRVSIAVEARKYRASGEGEETEVPMDGWVDIGVFGEDAEGAPPEGRILHFEKHRIQGPNATVEVVVDEVPLRAGIDPFNKLIDRQPENNVAAVEEAGAGDAES